MAMPNAIEAKRPCITNAIDELDPVIQRATEYASRLHKINDQINGTGPREAGTSQSPAGSVPHSLIASIHQRRSALVDVLDDMERSIRSIEGGI